MSTRCHIRVFQGLGRLEDEVLLYRHTDGYPSSIMPFIREVYAKYGNSWTADRVEKVASMLCAAAPAVVEPLGHHQMHGDVAYIYHLRIHYDEDRKCEPRTRWMVTIYQPIPDFWDIATMKNTRVVLSEVDITEMTKIETED